MLRRIARYILPVLLAIAFTNAAAGGVASVSCHASCDLAAMGDGDCGKTTPCKDMGAACAVSAGCTAFVGVVAHDALSATGSSMLLVRHMPTALPNGLAIAPHPTPPILA